jgi:hypothetical protein
MIHAVLMMETNSERMLKELCEVARDPVWSGLVRGGQRLS